MKFEAGKKAALFMAHGIVVYGKVVRSENERVVLDEGGFVGVDSLRDSLSGTHHLPLDRVPGEFQVAKGAILAAFDAELCQVVDADEIVVP